MNLPSHLKGAVVSALAVFGQDQATLLQEYLETDDKAPLSVWVDLLDMASNTAMVERLDPTGAIRESLRQGAAQTFMDWWYGPDKAGLSMRQYELPLAA